ncbi:YjbH domain-containing protein [Pseudidiomarina salinarum]|uniref:YjbH domain-containing protein n=1 Tax=Pseudidiomarina salinarum TaxID=435908 RepID=UPI00068B646D|nr:YjbH domain-containing protein [Pseudidiomarina salinarum]RUO70898.1 YjbH domain-containing protein [Pseudidiomarina salinarum]
MKQRITALTLALAFTISSHQAHAQQDQAQQVAIKVNGPEIQNDVITFAGSPRLSQVYNELQVRGVNMQNVHWPAVRLVSADAQEQRLNEQRELVQQLYQLSKHYREQGDDSNEQFVRRVAEQVASWPVIGAEPIGPGHVQTPEANTMNQNVVKKSSLSAIWDEARISIDANPLLPASEEQKNRYQLVVPTIDQHQDDNLQVIGAVWVPFVMDYNPKLTARETAQQEKLKQRLEDLSRPYEVTQITVDGITETIYIDPHNAYSQKFSSGAKVFVKFETSELPNEFADINEKLIELARYWNPLKPHLSTTTTSRVRSATLGPLVQEQLPEEPTLWLGEADDKPRTTTSDFGGTGLLQMPSGRMAEHGEFSFTYYDNEEYRRWAMSLQVFPWLETTIRYNDIRTRRYSPFPEFSGDQTYKDRGVDFKFRLLEESRWVPELSVGIRDLAGTGFFSGEFIAANKRFGDLDLTLGMGWGYLGKNDNISNPFCEITDDFCRRPRGFVGSGGDFEPDRWFRGPTSLFGGIEYHTPWDPLTLKLEYDGNDYRNEPAIVAIEQDSPWNLGFEYQVNDMFNVKLSFERGNTMMFGFTLRTNFNDLVQPKAAPGSRPPQAPKRPTTEQLKNEEAVQEIRNALYAEAGIWTGKLTLSADEKTLRFYGGQYRYREQELAIEKAGRVLASELPPTVETYSFLEEVNGMLLAQTNIDASQFKAAISRTDIQSTTAQSYSRSKPEVSEGEQKLFVADHQISWPGFTVKPFLEQSFGGPEGFYMYQISLDVRSSWSLTENLFVYGTLSTKVANNYDKFNFIAGREDGPLPRVRTYVREYVTMSDVWLRNLQLVYQKQLTDNWYAMAYGGYYELMFGGVGGEVLYRELDSNWAFGMDINYARQRSFENHTGFRDYDVITGHATSYWMPEFLPDSQIRLAIGQFLAGDRGAQVSFEHKFDSGIIAGAYAAKTNVSAEDYGEGSFTKGFYISIPFDLLQLQHSPKRGTISWSPLTRDGGQMLRREFSLFGFTDKRSPYYTE